MQNSKAEKQGLTNGDEQNDGPPLPEFLISTQEEHYIDEKQEIDVPPDQPQIGNDTNVDGSVADKPISDYTAEQAGVQDGTTVGNYMANNQKGESAAQARGNNGGVRLLQGQTELEDEYIKKGYELFLVAGISAAGKNFLLRAFDNVQGIDDAERVRLIRTMSGVIEVFSINNDFVRNVSTKRALVNIAGEDFVSMYPGLQESQAITVDDLKILKLLASNLRGLVLLFNLKAYWGPQSTEPNGIDDESGKKQVEIISWIMTVFRWLINGGTYPDNSPLDLKTYIQNDIHRMKARKTRLNIPVQVLFSKADELRKNKCVVPETKYELRPSKESPFFLAYHHLPKLHRALRRHANYFRYDFVRSALPNKDTGVDDINPCGVEQSFKWLLTPQSRFRFSTQRLIQIQRVLDTLFGRGGRWERYPIPKN